MSGTKLNIGIISQARMTSNRLPGKVLLEALGKPLLHYHLERLSWSKLPIFVATTSNNTDEPIVSLCLQENIPFYRGSEHDVLARFYECAIKFKLDVIIRVTSDCPLIDGNLIREAADRYLSKNDERLYLSNGLEPSFPRGFDFEIFSFKLLEEAFLNTKEVHEREHVTPYLYQYEAKNIRFENFKRETDESRYRLTIDVKEDLELIRKLIEKFSVGNLTEPAIVDILHKNPELAQINADIEQKKL